MKTFKDKKGFTLIELLAVIVVLAIVTVIATQSILPYMANAGRDAFVTEANLAIDGASDAMSLISIGSISSDNYEKKTVVDDKGTTETTDDVTNTVYCFTLENLNTIGAWSKDDDDYAGRVVVTVPASGNGYTYAVTMHSADYFVESTSGTIKNDEAVEYDAENAHKTKVFNCDEYKN